MVNLYRFCIAILFVAISFATAQENCRIEKIKVDYTEEELSSIVQRSYPSCVSMKAKGSWGMCFKDLRWVDTGEKIKITYLYGWIKPSGEFLSHGESLSFIEYKMLEKEICIDPKPDLTNWNNCKSGKDHGFSWITIGDAQGEGESRYKQEFWACDDPDIWITYNHPPESGGTADPNTPSNPNDDGKNGEDGEDGDSGSGKGDNTGSENGSDNGNAPTGNGNGKGLSQSEVQQAIENALDSKGKSLEGKINQWWLSTQGEMEKEGLRLGHEANSLLDSGLAGLVNEKDINQLDRTYRFQLGVAKTCPEPYVLNLGKYQIPIPFDIFCQFAEIMGYLVIASAYMSAIYIVMGLRK